MERVRLGIVGVGWIAQLIHLPILTKFPDAEVVAVCDKDRAKARLVAEKFGIARTYADLASMLRAEDLDAVIVSASTDAHRSLAVTAMEAGKDVLIEKPIARQYSEAVAIYEAAKASKRVVMVGMNHRFRPDIMILKSFLEGKELGKWSGWAPASITIGQRTSRTLRWRRSRWPTDRPS
jgi:predicted dehydrogenase